MDIGLDDIINVNLLKKKYEDYANSFASGSNIKTIVKDFISFIKQIRLTTFSSKLLEILDQQEKIAKRILLVYNIRYLLLIFYKSIIQRMISKLINLIRSFLSLI
ncbi:hypothetical protein [Acidianus ambivalens]|uniref:Uncharacterized protein n=1 Tax=Acidianus ambivalens TaxID=2283 RepID=A0A650CY44_ACIAM|nr:hypothetical protein [Acidianus ambivalens]MQL54942.1 hypothetical protein [Acidianus ambivalens]QGR22726.1 hypothetical protein D1866_12625 [Acidianus ambivalens]